MNFEEAVDKFVESPCRLTTGMPSLSKRWNIDLNTLYAAKASAKDILKNKEQFGTEYNPEDVAFTCRGKKADINIAEEVSGNTLILSDDPEENFKRYGLYFGTKLGPNVKTDFPTQEEKKELKEINARLLKKWGSEGNWKYSYDYSQDTSSQINFEEILNKVFNSDEKVAEMVYKEAKKSNNEYCENIYITDAHVGMDVSYSTYSNFFNKKIYRDRMDAILIDTAQRVSQYGKFNTINVDYLGDIFDGQDGYTVKRTHKLPQNMSNAEAFEVGLYTNKVFLERLFTSNFADNYSIHFVRESNHGGDMDLYLFKALQLWINTKFPNVEVTIAKRVVDHYIIGGHAFIYAHGKDNTDMKNGWPLTITPAIETYIDQYIKEYKLYEYFVHVISGDLHQDATTNSKLFRYRKVPALAGSSKWIMSNFGLTEPGVGIDIYRLNKKNVIQDVIEF
jgi:hypothetical protein